MSTTKKYRPLISSLAFRNQNVFIPFRYNFSIEEIGQIKKYLPKNLFKLHGIDAQSSLQLSQSDQQTLQKAKLKIKSYNGRSSQTQKPIQFIPKHQVTVLQWYGKIINLQIPYSSKSSEALIEQQINHYLSYYLEKFMFFKNTLSEELYTDLVEKPVKLIAEQIATQIDVVFTCWNIDPEHTDDKVKIIRTNLPIVFCLNRNDTYDLQTLKQLVKTDIMASLSIMLKHGFNTRVVTLGTGEKQFVCIASYTQEENVLQEEEKLKAIIGQQKVLQVETEEMKVAAKKDHFFLFIVLALLVLIYFGLKIFPIHGRNENQYMQTRPKSYESSPQINTTIPEEEIF